MKQEVFILDAKRSPIGKYMGLLSSIKITDIASQVITGLLDSHKELINNIDEIIFGNVLSAGLGQNPARIASFQGGLSNKIPAFTINQVCGSGLQSIIAGVQKIQLNEAECVLAGGMEGMSQSPHIIQNYRFGVRFGDQVIKDTMIQDGLYCSLVNKHMGVTAENLAKKFKISRHSQDKYALDSHKKAIKAQDKGIFRSEIVSIRVPSFGTVEKDEQPRRDTSFKKLSKLNPIFQKNGTVTAGNSSSLNDAAAVVLVVSKRILKKFKLKPLAVVNNYASVGLDPDFMGMGSYYAAMSCLKKANLSVDDVDLWEINEAFASQMLAVLQKLKVNSKKVNVNGGSIAFGHPIGASGARIMVTLLHELKRRNLRFGLASLCIGGGQGVAVLVENNSFYNNVK